MKETLLYKFLVKTYLKLFDSYNMLVNKKYQKSVKNLLVSGQVEQYISELKIKREKENNIYYIIKRDNAKIGLLTYVSVFMGHIAYALAKGYIPVIDMQNFRSIYQKEASFRKDNVWEHFFEQPLNIGLNDIPKNAKIVYSPKFTHPLSPFTESLFDNKIRSFWKSIAFHFIRPNEKTKDYFENEFNNLLAGKKVLGLLYRGTDYLNLKPKNHPIQPSLTEFGLKVEELSKEWGRFDYFYLATDDETAFTHLNEKFPGKIIVNKRNYYDKVKNIRFLADATFDREDDEYLKGIEYLSSILLLSSCDSIIASQCAGTYAANFLRKDNFTHSYFFNLGFY